MNGFREAPPPPSILYRVSRRPDPLAWPEPKFIGLERYDDPDPARRFRTLYIASEPLACYLEVLAAFRHDPETIAAWRAKYGSAEPMPNAAVDADWHEHRLKGTLRVKGRLRLLDVRMLETCAFLRHELAPTLVALNLPDLNPSTVRSQNRPLTQQVAAWAFEHSYAGILYRSRFDDSINYALDCWALFDRVQLDGGRGDGVQIERVAEHHPITRDDPDLVRAAQIHGLRL